MNRYRRVLAVAAGTVIGAIGAVALASPASAHHSEVVGQAVCDATTGEWVVTWTVNSYAPRSAPTYRLVEVVAAPDVAVSNIAVTEDTTVFPHTTGVPLVGEQRLPSTATSASLSVRAEWSNHFQEEVPASGTVTFYGPCEGPPPTVPPHEPGPPSFTPASTCEDLTVAASNPEDGEDVTAEIVPSTGEPVTVTLAPGESESVTFAAAEGLTFRVLIDDVEVAAGAWEDPGDCVIEIPIASLSDCDSLTIEVTNPLEDEAIEVTIASGDVIEVRTIEPGATAEVSFPGAESATVTIGDESTEILWEEPADCGGEGGDLPVTGPSTGIVIGGAVVLLALGGGLFLLARRRRITFSA